MGDNDLYQIERAARHVESALRGLDTIPVSRMSRDLLAQYKRLALVETRLMVIRDRQMRREGVTAEEVEEWDAP